MMLFLLLPFYLLSVSFFFKNIISYCFSIKNYLITLIKQDLSISRLIHIIKDYNDIAT